MLSTQHIPIWIASVKFHISLQSFQSSPISYQTSLGLWFTAPEGQARRTQNSSSIASGFAIHNWACVDYEKNVKRQGKVYWASHDGKSLKSKESAKNFHTHMYNRKIAWTYPKRQVMRSFRNNKACVYACNWSRYVGSCETEKREYDQENCASNFQLFPLLSELEMNTYFDVCIVDNSFCCRFRKCVFNAL